MKKNLIIFDMDGTILDTLDDLMGAINHSLAENGLPILTRPQTKQFVGNGIRTTIDRAVPNGTPEIKEAVYRSFMTYYPNHCADLTRPYDGVVDLIKKLRAFGYKTAVVSNKPDPSVQILCRDYFSDCFDFAIGEKEGYTKKPAPDMVNACLEALGETADTSLYIGDSEVDLATAANSCMDCLTVTWGFRDEEFLLKQGAVLLANSVSDMEKILLS